MLLSCLLKLYKNSCVFLAILILVSGNVLQAQEVTEDQVPALELIKTLEQRFEVRFSYNKSSLYSVHLPKPPDMGSLTEYLEWISDRSPLQFTQIRKRYIAVRYEASELKIVCGTLINLNTGTPLSGASIICNSQQTRTNSGGTFTLSGVRHDDQVSIYYLDYKIKEFQVSSLLGDRDCPIVFVDQAVNLLSTVLLETYVTRGISKNTDGSVAISNSDFEILPSLIEPDVLQIAQVLPGVESFDETASNINVRGGNTDELLLLWDDIRMYQSGHFFGLISAFNPNLTQDVTLYKNGTPPRYGEGVSGVLSMTSDNKIPEQVIGGAGITLTSGSLFAKIPANERLAFHISGRTSLNSSLGNPVYNEFFKKAFQNTEVTNIATNTPQGLRSTDEEFNFYDVSIKGIWEISDKDRLTYNFLNIKNKLNFTERFTNENTSSTTISELNQQSVINGANWQRKWTQRFTSRLSASSTRYEFTESDLEANTGTLFENEHRVEEKRMQARFIYGPTASLEFTSGFQYTDTEIHDTFGNNSEVSEDIRNSLTSTAAYLNGRWMLFEKRTILNLGIRYTDYSLFDKQFTEPRLHVYQKLTKAFSLQLAAEQKHQAVFQFTDDQNRLLGVQNKRWKLADGFQDPILKSKQVSLGVSYKNKAWTLTSEVFYKDVERINAANQGFRNQYENTEALGNYTSKGVEWSVNRSSKSFTIWFSYALMKNQYRFDLLQPAIFPHQLDVRHSVRLAASYTLGALQISLGTNYHSGLPYTLPVEENPVAMENGVKVIRYREPNGALLSDYFRTDFSANYKFRLDETFSGSLHLAFVNIFNRKNALARYYLLETDANDNATVNRVDEFSLGFTPNLSFQLRF